MVCYCYWFPFWVRRAADGDFRIPVLKSLHECRPRDTRQAGISSGAAVAAAHDQSQEHRLPLVPGQ